MHYRRRNPRNPRRSKRGKRRGRRPVRRCNSKNLRLSESGCRLFARMPLSDLWIHTSGSNPSPPLRTRTWSSHGRGIVENPQFTNPAQVPTPNFNLVLNGVHGWVRASESSLARLYRHCAVHRLPPSTHRHTNADSVAKVTGWEISKGTCSVTSAVQQTRSVSTCTQSLVISGKWSVSV